MNIVLTGFMATGKTEISKCLSQKLSMKLVDTDDLIVKKAGMSINNIFEKYGEKYFRNIESEIIADLANTTDTVISTGGGVVLSTENMNNLRKNGIIFNLSPKFDVIKDRLEKAAATRPLMKNSGIDEIEQRFNDRKIYYDNCDYKISITNSKSPAEHADEIISVIESL